MNTKRFLVFSIAAIFFSCGKSDSLTPLEMKAYFEDRNNGLIQHAGANDIAFTLTYKPLDVIVLQEMGSLDISKSDLEEAKKKYAGLEYFTLNIGSEKEKLGDMIRFDEKKGRQDSIASYVHFYMQRDFQMICGRDTSSCVLFHLEQRGNITPYISISLAFETLHRTDDQISIIYSDKVFGTGEQTFRFSKKDLQKIPSLKLKS